MNGWQMSLLNKIQVHSVRIQSSECQKSKLVFRDSILFSQELVASLSQRSQRKRRLQRILRLIILLSMERKAKTLTWKILSNLIMVMKKKLTHHNNRITKNSRRSKQAVTKMPLKTFECEINTLPNIISPLLLYFYNI